MSDKTEEPTPKKLRKAREDGNSPLSAFASQAIAFVAAVAIAPSAIAALASRASADLRTALAHAAERSPRLSLDLAPLGLAVIELAAPILVAAAIAAAVTSVVQTGGAIATKKLAPDFSRLDPIAGLGGLLSVQRLVSVLRAALFAAAVSWFTIEALRSHAPDLARATGRIDAALLIARVIALDVAKKAAAVGLFLAIVDVVVTRRAWRQKLRMSKAEVKREHRESDGDPQLKAARERAHHEMLAAVAIGNVKRASVVIVNPTHIACALRYDEEGGDAAPVLVASGHGDLAARIVAAAREYGVPVLRDVPLARALVELEIGDEIPEALYEAVAEILREIWQGSEESDTSAGGA